MNMKEYAADISLKEILAVVLRGGKKIILCATVFAVLFGAVSALAYYRPDEQTLEEQKQIMQEYESEKAELQATLEKAERDLANQKAYNENSLLMKLNPYNKLKSTIVVAISDINLNEITDPFLSSQNSIGYIMTRIQAQYMALWDGLNFEDLLADTGYSGIAHRYLYEVITLTALEGGILIIDVSGDNAADCEQIVRKMYEQLISSNETVAAGSYEHSLRLLSDATTVNEIDPELELKQQENSSKQDKYQKTIEQVEKELLELEEPAFGGGISGIVISVLAGAVIGTLIVVLFLICTHIIRSRVAGSAQLSARYGLVHLGTLRKKPGCWHRLGYAMMGEKVWKDEEQARSYIRENSLNYLNENSSVLIVSTRTDLDEDIKNTMVGLLGVKGCRVAFAEDVAHNAQALTALVKSDAVVLAEQAFVSQHTEVMDLLDTVKKLDKPVCGFVLL